MLEWLGSLSAVTQALMGSLFTWALTALGAALVFLFRSLRRGVLNAMLGFAAGVMIAASFWSLLEPALAMAQGRSMPSWAIVAIGFLAGGGFLYIVDRTLPHLHLGLAHDQAEGVKTGWQRSVLLVLAITLHNIPEGLALGVAFGAVASGIPSASLAGAVVLTLGLGIQNFPEGAAVSIPLRREGFSRAKAFAYGQASGIVEPFAAVLGAAAMMVMEPVLPYALAFAAGAMIYVVVEELIPEAQQGHEGSRTDIATLGCMAGFTIMMVLDVALG